MDHRRALLEKLEALDDDGQWPPAENVHILTSAPLELVEKWTVFWD